MADKIPLKLVSAGSGVGTLAEMAAGDTVPLAQLANAISVLLAGYAAGGNVAVAATDSILAAIQKLQGQVTARAANGANSDITSLTGLTTALSVLQGGTGVTTVAGFLAALQTAGAYGKTNAVGTVSQTSGVPTGAIVETGTNANGTYTKWADGTMICTYSANLSMTLSAVYTGTAQYASMSWGFPVAFVGAVPVIQATAVLAPRITLISSTTSASLTSASMFAVDLAGAAAGTYVTKWIAVGRWF